MLFPNTVYTEMDFINYISLEHNLLNCKLSEMDKMRTDLCCEGLQKLHFGGLN